MISTQKIRNASPWLFILPALLFYVIFLVIPVLGTTLISFFDWDGISFQTIKFLGIGNYTKMMTDQVFFKALFNNLVLVVFAVIIEVIFSLGLAVLLERGLPLSKFFRGIYFIPTVMSFVVVGIVFTLFLSPSLGVFNQVLESIGLGNWTYAWLGDKRTALPIIVLIQVWKQFGLSMFLLIAGLETIPDELYEASCIDGSNAWKDLIYISLPGLKQVIAVVIMLSVIHCFKSFDLVYVMTSGGPNHATEILITWMYTQGFLYNNLGYGSAIAVVLLVITLLLSFLQLRNCR